MNRVKYILLFLFINFGGLALGSWLMNGGSTGEWYAQLNKAPWTPPGWVFGVAWTLIMICFSIYLTFLFTELKQIKPIRLFIAQVILNVSWNFIFFNKHLTILGLIVIILLTAVIFTFFLIFDTGKVKRIRYLLVPYMVWLCIATSLNAYVVFNN